MSGLKRATAAEPTCSEGPELRRSHLDRLNLKANLQTHPTGDVLDGYRDDGFWDPGLLALVARLWLVCCSCVSAYVSRSVRARLQTSRKRLASIP